MRTPKDSLGAALVAVVLALSLAAPASAADPALLASWSFDTFGQTAIDSTGNGNDGQLGAHATPDSHDPVFIDGRFGRGLAFDRGAYVDVPDTARLEPSHVTVSAWVRRRGTPGRWRYVLSKGALDCNRSSYGLYSAANGGLAFYVSDQSTYFVSPTAEPAGVWDGNWHHVAGSFDGATVRLYVDGSEIGSGSPAPIQIAYGVGSKGIYIGAYRGSCFLPFAGDIDEVQVWGDVRSAPEIAADAARSQDSAGRPIALDVTTASGPSRPQACYAIWLDRKVIPVRRRVRLLVTVRDRGRPLTGVRLTIRGGGVRASAITRRRGRAGVLVRARWRAKLRIAAVGQRGWCPKPTIRVGRR